MPAKSGFPLKRASLLLLLMLTGCALRVPVRQLRLPDKLPPEELGALKAIYLVLRLADAETASADKLARAVGLAAEIRRAVEGPSSRVVAYQITASDEPADYFIAQSSATGVLWLNLPATEPDPPPQEVGASTATASARPVEASLTAPYHLYAEPGHRLILKDSASATHKSTSTAENHRELARLLAANLAKDLAVHPMTLHRVVEEGAQPELKEAYQAAKEQRWPAAVTLWKKVSTALSDDWTPLYNLGVAQEKEGRFDLAQEYYAMALERENSKPRPKKSTLRRLRKILETLSRLAPSSPEPPEGGAAHIPAWLRQKLAVLPMSNETVDIEAPQYVRAKLHQALSSRGYRVLPLQDVDEKLKEIGVTDGGQLKAYSTQEIAKALDAELLFHSRLMDFRVVPLGIYYERVVQAHFTLITADNDAAVLDWEEKVQYQSVSEPKKWAEALAWQILERQVSKILKTQLKEETEILVLKCVNKLPAYFNP